MFTPDRLESSLSSSKATENPKKNGQIPSWARIPTLAGRLLLAALTTSPAIVLGADAISQAINPEIAYADGGAFGKLLSIERLEECKWDIHMEAKGLPKDTPIQMDIETDSYSTYNCSTGGKVNSVGLQGIKSIDVGTTDASGQITIDYLESRYGFFNFYINAGAQSSDQIAFIDIVYSKSEIPINTPAPTATTEISPTATPTRTITPTVSPSFLPEEPTPTFAETLTPSVTVTADILPVVNPTPIPELNPAQSRPNTPDNQQGIPTWLWAIGAGLVGIVAGKYFFRKPQQQQAETMQDKARKLKQQIDDN